ncbi:MAG TPA: hypothetical protein VFB06_10010 [Streptosporangiaceae bacterium]|nr:hypothetical protein [Streptosporangiaceae bacterium]
MGRPPRLGIDIGKVIINGPAHPAGGDTAFFEGDDATMLATPEMDGCVAAIARLISLFGGQVWLVSKCGRPTWADVERRITSSLIDAGELRASGRAGRRA